jgi:DNA repair exonuclease SbcCD ATPase subunit
MTRLPREKNMPASRGSTSDSNHPDREVPELNKEQMMDAIERYKNRQGRMDKLTRLQTEFRERIKNFKEKQVELEEHVQKAKQSHIMLASNRQLYHEVDSKSTALNAAKRDSETCKNKSDKLQDSVDSLRRFIPRLLSKICKMTQPVPTTDQVGYMI